MLLLCLFFVGLLVLLCLVDYNSLFWLKWNFGCLLCVFVSLCLFVYFADFVTALLWIIGLLVYLGGLFIRHGCLGCLWIWLWFWIVVYFDYVCWLVFLSFAGSGVVRVGLLVGYLFCGLYMDFCLISLLDLVGLCL